MRKSLAVWAVTLILVGCSGSGLGIPGTPVWFATTPPAEQATYFRTRCESYGFKAGTDAMAQCIQNEALSSRNRRARRITTTHCNATPFGGSVNCTTY